MHFRRVLTHCRVVVNNIICSRGIRISRFICTGALFLRIIVYKIGDIRVNEVMRAIISYRTLKEIFQTKESNTAIATMVPRAFTILITFTIP